MIILEGADSFPKAGYTVVTIGTFDGVHIGHQEILNKISKQAKENKGVSIVITFWPHPRYVLQGEKESGLKLLSTFDDKAKRMADQGIDYLVKIPFTKEFSQTSSEDFIRNTLEGKLGTTHLVIGYDHHFGRNREGSFEYLANNIDDYGFSLQEIPRQDIDHVGVSSTKIRKALNEGKVDVARSYLGRNYEITGEVVHGEKLGREIGYPTANIQLSESYKLIPIDGIYVVKVIHKKTIYFGMMYIGIKPTVHDNNQRVIEVNIFEFDEDIYGEVITIDFLEYIRADKKFENLDLLKKQIADDKIKSLNVLGKYTKNDK